MFKTPLRELEEKLGANFGEFANWEMPMSYGSYQEEHLAVRNNAAIFDISHMGRLLLRGSIRELDYLIAKDIKNSQKNQMIGPTAFLNDKGGFIDDVMVYKLSESEFFVVTNAVNREKVIKWINNNSSLDVEDLTFKYGMVAIQGRRIWDFLPQIALERLSFKINDEFLGNKVFLISRSGWTGEDGIEIWAEEEALKKIFAKAIELGIKPAGLISRDSLRLEMGFVLYGADINESINPIEARYPVFSLEKDFIGKNAIVEYIKSGVNKFRIGFKAKKGERSIPRNGDKVYILDQEIGEITSGSFSPYLQRSIGMGYVDSKHFLLGFSVSIVTKMKRIIEAKIQDFPFI